MNNGTASFTGLKNMKIRSQTDDKIAVCSLMLLIRKIPADLPAGGIKIESYTNTRMS